jgi:hypothetical protein
LLQQLAPASGALFLDADNRGFAHGHAPVILISSLISSMLEMTTGVRVDLAFSSSTARSNSMMVSPRFHLLTFLSDAGEAFAFQLNGVDTEVNEQLDTS